MTVVTGRGFNPAGCTAVLANAMKAVTAMRTVRMAFQLPAPARASVEGDPADVLAHDCARFAAPV